MTLTIGDNVSRVIGDDIHIDFHPARMRSIDKGLEVFTRADVGIDIGKVRNPIAVIAGRFLPLWPLHWIVLKDWR